MKVVEVKKYVGKNVLIILQNKFKYTAVIPEFTGESFSIIDRYGHRATIECDSISVICERGELPWAEKKQKGLREF